MIGAMFLLIAVLFKGSLPDMFAGIRRVHPHTESMTTPSSDARGRGSEGGVVKPEMRGDSSKVLGIGHHIGFAEHIRIHELLLLTLGNTVEIKRADNFGADFIKLVRGQAEPGVCLMKR